MTENKALTAPAAALTVTGYEPAGYARTAVHFSDGSSAIMIEVDRSGFSRAEARRIYGEERTDHLPGNCLEVAIPEATNEQWAAFQRDLLEDARQAAREEEAYRAEQYAMLEDKVEHIRRDFTLQRIPALQKLKDACNTHGFGYLFREYAPTI